MYWIANIPLGVFFFSAGLLLKTLQYNRWMFVFAVIIYGAFCLTEIPYVGMFTGNLVQGNYLLWPVFAISGCVVINNVFKYLQKLGFTTLFRPIEILGLHSMTYYVQHWIVLVITLYVAKRYSGDNGILAIIALVTIIVFSTLFVMVDKRLRLKGNFK